MAHVQHMRAFVSHQVSALERTHGTSDSAVAFAQVLTTRLRHRGSFGVDHSDNMDFR